MYPKLFSEQITSMFSERSLIPIPSLLNQFFSLKAGFFRAPVFQLLSPFLILNLI